MMIWLICLSIVASGVNPEKLIFSGTADIEKKTLVQTESGPISGLIFNRNNINVNAYLAVPYAMPPIGDRRFERATLVKPWKNTYKANKPPPSCYQVQSKVENPLVRQLVELDPQIADYLVLNRNEDCLYLSIYTSGDVKDNKTVLVWLHGGDFVSGSPVNPIYDYANIVAADPRLIVVAVNYRLNVFGFLTTGTEEMPGNFGFDDQWIKQNIARFGGNPNRVVIWGQNAGATSVGLHMMSTKSGDKLFQRAILQSGDPLIPTLTAKPKYRQEAFTELLREAKCPLTISSLESFVPWIKQNFPQILTCFRKLKTEELFSKYQKVAIRYPWAFLPNPRDKSLFQEQESFWKGVQQQKFTFSGNILIGTDEVESSAYLKIGPLAKYYNENEVSEDFTMENILKAIEVFSPTSLETVVKPTINILLEGVPDRNNGTQLWHRYVKLYGDLTNTCTNYFFIDNFLKKSRSQSSVYYYRFNAKVANTSCPKWSLGACQADELGLLFGNPLLSPAKYPEADLKLTHNLMSTWVQFAHNGNPVLQLDNAQVEWPAYTQQTPQYMTITAWDSATLISGFPGFKCAGIFQTFYDVIDSATASHMKMLQASN